MSTIDSSTTIRKKLERRRRPRLGVVPRRVPFYLVKYSGTDEWGKDSYLDEAEYLKGKIDMNYQKKTIYVGGGLEITPTAVIMFHGDVEINEKDRIYYTDPNGVEYVFKIVAMDYVHDLTGNAFQTKVTVNQAKAHDA